MKKEYHLSYEHITGLNSAETYFNIFDFYLRLGEVMEDSYVSNHTISFHTEVIKPIEPVIPVYTPTNEELQTEREYNQFKGFKK